MASGGKKKTTMAKLMRETKLRERRMDKQARKDARKRSAADGEHLGPEVDPSGELDERPNLNDPASWLPA